jgi:hypothetical protein
MGQLVPSRTARGVGFSPAGYTTGHTPHCVRRLELEPRRPASGVAPPDCACLDLEHPARRGCHELELEREPMPAPATVDHPSALERSG